MEYEELLQTSKIFTKSRVETLSDGVFAIAMTILVTTLEVPRSVAGISPAGLDVLIVKNLSELGERTSFPSYSWQYSGGPSMNASSI